MELSEFQNFIGKHIDDFNVISSELKHDADLNQYDMFSEVGYEFYGKTYHNLTITTNDQDIIKDIKIYMNGIVDKTFYDTFNNNYDLPSDIRVVDFEKVISEGKTEGGLVAYVKDHIFFLKKGNFEDKPQYLIWNNEDYQIMIFIRYDIKMSEIIFKSTNK